MVEDTTYLKLIIAELFILCRELENEKVSLIRRLNELLDEKEKDSKTDTVSFVGSVSSDGSTKE